MTNQEDRLNKLDTDKLIDVVKNYRQYGYDENLRSFAISILTERGITKEQLELAGNFKNTTYDFADELYKSFSKNSVIALSLYGLVILTTFLLSNISGNSGALGLSVAIFKVGTYIFYLVFLIKSFLNQSAFYKTVGQNYGADGALLYLFLGMPFYVLMYFYFRGQMRQIMTEIK